MKPEKVWNALEFYKKKLAAWGFEAEQIPDDEYDKILGPVETRMVLKHCGWMCEQCLDVFKPEFEGGQNLKGDVTMADVLDARKPLEKAMRWLGYVQGVLHAFGYFTLNDLRDHSRGGEGAFKTAREEHAPLPVRRTFPTPSPLHLIEADYESAELKNQACLWQSAEQAPPLPPDAGLLEYPCCESVTRVETVSGDRSTLTGGVCPIHGKSVVRRP